jgi:hypothetical protein
MQTMRLTIWLDASLPWRYYAQRASLVHVGTCNNAHWHFAW